MHEAAPLLPISSFRSLEDELDTSLLPQRIAGGVAGVLGVIGLMLTAVGLHGVIAYSVSRRSSEIGVRMSLGARPVDILRMMMRQGVVLALLGLGIGVPAAAIATRFLTSFLVGLNPIDLVTYLGIASLLLATSLLACYLPARRAARIDPWAVLRSE